MDLRHKVVVLAVAPLMVVAPLLVFMIEREGSALADGQVTEAEEVVLAAKRDELSHLMAVALKEISELEASERNDEVLRSQVLALLRRMSYGEDSYFWVHDVHDRMVMHPRLPELNGRDVSGLVDEAGQIVPRLTAKARAGGGFVNYSWSRPTQGRSSRKLSYVVLLPRWDWVVGTGIYLDDVSAITGQIRTSSDAAIGDATIFIVVIAVLAAVVVAALGMALNVSQQRLASSKLRVANSQVLIAQEAELAAQEAERARVVLELHDDVLPDLTAIRIDCETALTELRPVLPGGVFTEMMEQTPLRLSTSIDEIRLMCRDLRPPFRSESLPMALDQIVRASSRRSGVMVTLDVPATLRVQAPAAMALLRVIQQALNNIERHARASRVTIRMARCGREGSGISLTVSDDGCGFDVDAVERRADRGIGLLSMRVRMEALGGQFSIQSGPNGTEIEASLPDDALVEDS